MHLVMKSHFKIEYLLRTRTWLQLFRFYTFRPVKNCFPVGKCGLTAYKNFKFEPQLIQNYIFSQEHAQNTTFFTILTGVILRHPKSLKKLPVEVFRLHYKNPCNSFIFIKFSIVNKG